MTNKIPHGTTARVLLALAREVHARGTLMPPQTAIARAIGRGEWCVYTAWRKLRDAGVVRARLVRVGDSQRVFVEEVRG